tara:strand:- start:109 stop:513 length:405 start_codon:yes stop_codon:yes gene_type:complete
MSKFTAALNDAESPLYEYLRTDGPRDIGAYIVQTGTIGEAYPEFEYEKLEVFAIPSSTPREGVEQGEGQQELPEVMLHGIELIMFVGSQMAASYAGAMEFSHAQAKELLDSEEFAIFNGDDIEARNALMAALRG